MEGNERELSEYLKDIRQIRETMLRAEDRLHIPAWYFFVMAGILGLATTIHAVAHVLWSLELHTALLAIWLPTFILAGVVEVAAWVEKGRVEGLPWLSRGFGRFLAEITGIMTGVVAIGVVAMRAGYSVPGILLIISAAVFLAYSPYSPSAAIWIGWVLLAPGVGLLIAHLSGFPLTLIAAALIVGAFLVAGIAERKLQRDDG